MSKVCPECKHNNENDSIVCEKCGCDLEQYKIDSKKSNNKRIESSYYKSTTNNEINERPIVSTKKPKTSPRIIIGTLYLTGVILANLWYYFIMDEIDSVIIVLSFILVCGGIYFIKDGINDLKNVNKIYQENINDENYCKNLIQNYYDDKYESERIDRQIIYNSLKPKQKTKRNIKCPYCGSYNTKKISVSSRALSTTITGMASSKIGKQWHCNDCGSNF